jgi:hypothetical protein
MATLYDLTNDLQQIQHLIETGDYTEEQFADTIESINLALEDKLKGYAMVIRNIESDIDGLKTEEKRLSERRKSLENGVKRLKTSIEDSMLKVGTKKIKTELFSFNIQKNPPSVEVLNDSEIPESYFTVPAPVLDKKAILADLKNGAEVPGVQMKQGESLRIR